MYIISDGNGTYIRHDTRTGKYVPTKHENHAKHWDRRDKAANVLNSSINKNLRNRYRIIEIKDVQDQENKSSCESGHESLKKDMPTQDCSARLEGSPIDNDISDVINSIAAVVDFMKDSNSKRQNLTAMLSEVDREISDIHHYIELGKFNAYQGWMAFSMLQKRLRKRRKIKDQITVLIQLEECRSFAEIGESILKLNERHYSPRILSELFSDNK